MSDGKNRFVAVSSGGLRLALPIEFVLRVEEWRRPETLPFSVDWMMGIRPGESTVKPVLRQSFWGNEDTPPEVLLLLNFKGNDLGIPGAFPVILNGRPRRAADREGLHDCLEWSIMENGGVAWCVNVPLLYRTLNLGYDEEDNIGGLDA